MPGQRMQPYTIKDFERDFPDDATCLEWLKNHLYPNGITCQNKACPRLGRITKHYRVASRRSYSCAYCGHHVHPTTGTIFHKSPTPLRVWFHAIFQMASTRCGISAKQIQRETGVTYKTAWRMFTQIRKLLDEPTGKLKGYIEVDETCMGGKRRTGKRGRPSLDPDHPPVFGIVERKGRVHARVTKDVRAETIHPIVKAYVLPKSTIFSDEMNAYMGLKKRGYAHKRIKHKQRVYVVGNVHTNTIEGFWSLLKRGIAGVYHAVSAKQLQSYINEYAFRYNHRHDVQPMFTTILRQVASDLRPSEGPLESRRG